MINRNLVRGIFLMGLALVFGLPAIGYSLGTFSRAGPGLFPFMVSVILFAIGVISVVRSRLVPPEPMDFQVRNISIILGSLCGFAILSHYLNMIVGTSYSVVRNIKITVVLIAIAFAFQKLLGVSLPLL